MPLNSLPAAVKWGFPGLALLVASLLIAQLFGGIGSVDRTKNKALLTEMRDDLRAIKPSLFGIESRLKLVEYRLSQLEKSNRSASP